MQRWSEMKEEREEFPEFFAQEKEHKESWVEKNREHRSAPHKLGYSVSSKPKLLNLHFLSKKYETFSVMIAAQFELVDTTTTVYG